MAAPASTARGQPFCQACQAARTDGDQQDAAQGPAARAASPIPDQATSTSATPQEGQPADRAPHGRHDDARHEETEQLGPRREPVQAGVPGWGSPSRLMLAPGSSRPPRPWPRRRPPRHPRPPAPGRTARRARGRGSRGSAAGSSGEEDPRSPGVAQVEQRRRLVGHQHGRLCREHAREREQLALPPERLCTLRSARSARP